MLIKLVDMQQQHLQNIVYMHRRTRLFNESVDVGAHSQYFTGASRQLQRAVDWFVYLQTKNL
jgi:hypothetical protein